MDPEISSTTSTTTTSSTTKKVKTRQPSEASSPVLKKPSSLSKKPSSTALETSKITNKNFIKMNVGGTIYSTTKTTLCSGQNFFTSLFRNMENGMETTLDDGGLIFIDRNGKLFTYILEYLRNGVLDVPKELIAAVRREMLFFSIPIPIDHLAEEGEPAWSPASTNIIQWAIIKCTSTIGNTWIVTSSSFSKEYYGINGWIEALNSLSSKGYQLYKFYQHDCLEKQTIWMFREEEGHKH